MTQLDCLIVGGGPAGATAAMYLARFRRRAKVFDTGASRTRWISSVRNYPGFPEGISGNELLDRMRRQAAAFGAVFEEGEVERIVRSDEGFEVVVSGARHRGRYAILATGLQDRLPEIPGFSEELIVREKVRLCPICDGHDFMQRRLAVCGEAGRALKEALFLRTYTDSISLYVVSGKLSEAQSQQLAEMGIEAVSAPLGSIAEKDGAVMLACGEESRAHFDAVYLALGATPRSQLATALGATANEAGCLEVDAHRETNIKGLFSIGDVVDELDQVSVAVGHAAIAATAIHNRIARDLGER